MRKFLVIIALFSIFSCDDDGKESFGKPCSESTVCEGVCNLGLPDGMCTEVCSDQAPCEQGVCVDFTDTEAYCLPSCEANSDCRQGYSCINFFCAPVQDAGGQCDDDNDCLDCENSETCPEQKEIKCMENICAFNCRDQSECPDGTVCALSGGDYWCIGIYFQQGDGTAGEPCPNGTCASGFTCLDDFPASETGAFCSNECTTSRECPPDMTCRNYADSEASWCVPRAWCEECDLDFQCGFSSDLCVLDESGSAFCGSDCDPQVSGTCPVDSECSEVFLCTESERWVTDCDSVCTGGCSETDAPVYQCLSSWGSCTGDGTICSPCKYDAQCEIGSNCVFIPESGSSICASTCTYYTDCPDGYICEETTTGSKSCVPRTGSCVDSSGDRTQCEICAEDSDCLRGKCLPLNGSEFSYCLDFCDNNAECGFYSQCTQISVDSTEFSLCVPDENTVDCTQSAQCLELCPSGPSSCTTGPVYCQ